MKRKMKKSMPILVAVLLIAALWLFGSGRGAQHWNDLLPNWLGVEGPLERADGDFGSVTYGPGMMLRAGTYRLDYNIETDAPNTLRFTSVNRVGIVPAEVDILPENPIGSVEFTVLNEAENFEILADYEQGGFLRVNDLDLTGNRPADRTMTLTLLLLGFIVLDILYLRGGLTRERAALLLVLGFAVLIASAPCFKKNLVLGDDMNFHLARLSNITGGLLQGQFPVRMGGYMNRGFGAVTSVYYADLFLYIPAAMILLGTTIPYAMHVFLVLINLVTAASMFICARRLLKSEGAGALASILYTLASYRLVDLYTRSAVGEALAMAFLPLFVLGLWEVFFGDREKWPLLALSAAAIFESHMISTLLCAVLAALLFLLFLRKLVREKRLRAVFKAAGCCVLLCAFALLPLLTYSMSGVTTGGLIHFTAEHADAPAQLLFMTTTGLDTPVSDITLSDRALEIGAPLLLAGLVTLCGLVKKKGWNASDKAAAFLLAAGAAVSLAATELFPWAHLDSLTGGLSGYIQFPCRLLMFADCFLALAGAYGLSQLAGDRQEGMRFAALALCMVTVMPLLTAQAKDRHILQEGSAMNAAFVNWDYMLEGTEPEDIEDRDVHALGGASVSHVQKAGTTILAEVSAEEDGQLSLPLFGFEGYRAEVDGQEVPAFKGEDRRLTVELPAGTAGSLRVSFAGRPLWHAADVLSLLTLAALLVRGGLKKKKQA